MPRYTIPSTNQSFITDLQPVFNTYSLGTMGSRIYPRETAGGTAVSELRPTTYLYHLPTLLTWDDIQQTYGTLGLGTVQYDNPFSLGPGSGSVEPYPNYIVNDDTYGTITITATDDYPYVFSQWVSVTTDTVLSTFKTATFSINDSLIYGTTFIRAEYVQ